jgi:RHS repeat-associated protein
MSDPLGTGMVLVDSDGERVRHQVFTPFGGIHAEQGASLRTFYAGHRRNDETGMYYMQARWFDPGSGRFLSTDPMIRTAFVPQSANAYSYSENNPVNQVDPTGMLSLTTTLPPLPSPWRLLPGVVEVGGGVTFSYSGTAARKDNDSSEADESEDSRETDPSVDGDVQKAVKSRSGGDGGVAKLAQMRVPIRSPNRANRARPRPFRNNESVRPGYRPPGEGTSPGVATNPTGAIIEGFSQVAKEMPGTFNTKAFMRMQDALERAAVAVLSGEHGDNGAYLVPSAVSIGTSPLTGQIFDSRTVDVAIIPCCGVAPQILQGDGRVAFTPIFIPAAKPD